MKKIIILFVFLPLILNAQFVDNFDDGDFTQNPAWIGDDSLYAVNNNVLQLNNAATPKTAYLVTANTLMDSTTWKFYIKIEFAPSSTSFARVYLVSNSSNLLGSLNGYYLQFGEANNTDVVRLFRQTGTASTQVCAGTTSIASSVNLNIMVTRRGNGNWALYTAPAGSTNYTLEATGIDNTYTTTSYFGIYSKFSTLSYLKKFSYDDFSVDYYEADISPPTISTISVLSDSTLEVKFSEPITLESAENEMNYIVSDGIDNPYQVIRSASDFSKVTLYFGNKFTSGFQYTLSVENIKDLSNNTIVSPASIHFTYYAPVVIEKYDVVINEIFADPSPQIGLPTTEFIEIYNRSSKIINLQGWKFTDGTSTGTLGSRNLLPGNYLILCANADTNVYKVFGPTMGLSTWPSLNNAGDNLTLKSNNDLVIDFVSYSDTWYNDPIKKDGGWTLERIRYSDTCSLIGNWSASVNPIGGTPGTQNSIFNAQNDITGPKTIGFTITSVNTVSIIFDETLDQISSTQTNNYIINQGMGNPVSATLGGIYKNQVELTLQNDLDTGTIYQCIISSVADCKGNVNVTPDTARFQIFNKPKPNDIVFSEIMADPDPPVDLPNCEYIEIFNRASYSLNLKNFKFIAGTSTKILPEYIINPGEYVLICGSNFINSFSNQIKKIGLSSFPALTNGGMSLTLQDSLNNVISQVTYSDSWYNDPIKKNGGWSLEKIDVYDICSQLNHWSASMNPMGGTPGLPNSLDILPPDVIGPKPQTMQIENPHQLIAFFDETIDATGLMALNINIYPAIPIQNVSIYGQFNNAISINLQNPIDTGVLYSCKFNNIKDCKGNHVLATDSLIFMIYRPAKKHDVIINEIMADPDPVVGLPNCEYIELYSRRNEAISLKNWKFVAGTTTRILPDVILFPYSYLLICPATYLSQFPNDIQKIGLSSFPLLTNGGMTLTLKDSTDKIINTVSYSDTWYMDSNKKNGGWSLELINPEDTCSFLNNWRASDSYSGGTPGYENSIISLMPDLIGPKIVSTIATSNTSFTITFDETIDTLAAKLVGNYVIHGIGNPISAQALGPYFNKVRVVLANPIDTGITYKCTFINFRDCKGNLINPTDTAYFTLFYPPKPYDVVINEIMADPDPVVGLPNCEYLEFYNRRNYPVSLYNWKLVSGSTSKTLPDIVIPAKSYHIICPNTCVADFPNNISKTGLSSFTTLTNSGMLLTLKDSLGKEIYKVSYSDSWYNDAVKKNGGWSLELVNPDDTCGLLNNWKASINETGGTPGTQNSVFSTIVDNTGPTLQSVSVINNSSIVLTFDETLSSSATILSNFSINQGFGQPSAAYITGIYSHMIILQLPYLIDTGKVYTVTANNIADCKGNVTTTPASLEFGIYWKAKPYTIVINEIMADPDPQVSLPNCEYFELYNRNNFPVNLKNYKIFYSSSSKIIPEVVIQPNNYLLICPQSYLNEFPSNINKIGLSSFPSFANTGQSLMLKDSLSNLIHAVTYSDTWYGDNYKKNGGWSLEQIDFNNPCGERNNWKASTNVKGGTPGFVNSVNANNPDNKSPEIYRIGYINERRIKVYFTEPMDSSTLKNPANYEISPSLGNPVRVHLLEPDYKTIYLDLASDIELGVVYTLTVNNFLKDCIGNNIIATITGKFAMPELADVSNILINEILANSYDGGTDFVEIYNNSTKVIDLRDLTIGSKDSVNLKNVSLESFLMFPEEYMVLTKDTGLVKKFYYTPNPNNFVAVPSFPAYSATSGGVILSLKNGTIIDQLNYNDKMHHPLLKSTKGVSLERISFILGTNEEGNWHSASEKVGFATPAYKNSQYSEFVTGEDVLTIEPEIFSPDNDGFEDVVSIQYKFEKPGSTANIAIYDAKGRLVKIIAKNSILNASGFFIWDGYNTDRVKVPIGIYIVQFEAFDLTGKVYKLKKPVVVATKF